MSHAGRAGADAVGEIILDGCSFVQYTETVLTMTGKPPSLVAPPGSLGGDFFT
jgi:hypothetical protein